MRSSGQGRPPDSPSPSALLAWGIAAVLAAVIIGFGQGPGWLAALPILGFMYLLDSVAGKRRRTAKTARWTRAQGRRLMLIWGACALLVLVAVTEIGIVSEWPSQALGGMWIFSAVVARIAISRYWR